MNAFLSDLFFNLDHSDAIRKDGKGQFLGYADGEMKQQAEWFLSALEGLGVTDLPTADDLVADFKARL